MENKNKLSFVYVAVFAVFCAVSIIYMNFSVPERGEVSNVPLVRVYVKGEIKNPGVYDMNVTDRVIDAINKAGGANKNGDISMLDQARFLEDGETITVPSVNNNSENQSETYDSQNSGKININTASKELLTTLDGIGESLAERIIKYRNEHGNFADVHDLLNVSGIGKKKLEKIKDIICIN